MRVNFSTVITGLTTAAILAFIAGVWDFQGLKARVADTEKGITKVSHKVEVANSKIDVIAKITCKRAILDKLIGAEDICLSVMDKENLWK